MRTLEERFWSKVDKSGNCWVWTRGTTRGYGVISLGNGIRAKAHRVAYQFVHGPIPLNKVVCHTCDVTACVRPEHLFLAGQAENIADMVNKGRQARGSRARHAKLSEDDVTEIQSLWGKGFSRQELADKFKVGRDNINKILRGASWKHVQLTKTGGRDE